MRLATGILFESMGMTVVSGQKKWQEKKAASDYVEWISRDNEDHIGKGTLIFLALRNASLSLFVIFGEDKLLWFVENWMGLFTG